MPAVDGRGHRLLTDLNEVRTRVIRALIVLAAATALAFAYSQRLLQFVIQPVGELIYLAPSEALMVHFRLALMAGIVVALPYFLASAAAFAGRRVKRRTRLQLYLVLLTGFALFILGSGFAATVVVPSVLAFFMSFASDKVKPMLDLGNYVGFVFGIVIPFGLVFQLPLTMAALARVGLLSPATLARNRRVAILVIFVLAAVLTPPDVVSQLMMAGPLLVLYELGVLLGRLAWRAHTRAAARGSNTEGQ